MRKKIQAVVRPNRVDVISAIARDTASSRPHSLFWNVAKTRTAGACDGSEGAINAGNARAHERPEGSSRFRKRATRVCTDRARIRCALTAIRAPRVLLSLRQLPASLLLYVCVRVYLQSGTAPIRILVHVMHRNERTSERANKQAE